MSYRFDRDELFSLAGWLTRIAADLDDTVFAANEALARTHRSSSAVGALGRVGAESEARAADLGRRAAFLGEITAGQVNVEGWSSAWDRRLELAALWGQVDA
ncbi:MAG: hypothetical protein OEY55_14520, partial [Acidimicrobiia bacterium]|nr:hypothetical protein [Acidimicrobiia bacterium]